MKSGWLPDGIFMASLKNPGICLGRISSRPPWTKTNMTGWKTNYLKMYFLLKWLFSNVMLVFLGCIYSIHNQDQQASFHLASLYVWSAVVVVDLVRCLEVRWLAALECHGLSLTHWKSRLLTQKKTPPAPIVALLCWYLCVEYSLNPQIWVFFGSHVGIYDPKSPLRTTPVN